MNSFFRENVLRSFFYLPFGFVNFDGAKAARKMLVKL